MKITYFFILPFIFLCCNLLQAQDPQEKWVLETPTSGNKTYTAKESITLKPGFSYTGSSGNKFTAKIDPTLLFPPTGNTYAKSDGTITTDPKQGAVVGNLSGAFGASQTGAATYTVPIEVPPGIQGMQPNISLVYNSQSGNGIAGMCWNIGGLSMISRVPKDYYFDKERSGIVWDNNSPLALDGQRLIKVQEWGTDSIEYRTESGVDRIVGYNINDGVSMVFKVYTKDGKILEYGNITMDASYYPIASYPIATTTPPSMEPNRNLLPGFYHLGWALTRIVDTNNNFIEFTYISDLSYFSPTGGRGHYEYKNVRISSISYGNQTGTTKETVGKVDFIYKERTNPCISYIDGWEISNKYILDTIKIKGINDLLLTAYAMSYTTQDKINYLNQIKKANASGESINPLKFDWSPMTYSYTYTKNIAFGSTPLFATPLDAANFVPRHFGDIDGDGFTDLLVEEKKTTSNSSPHYWSVFRNKGNNSYECLLEQAWDYDYEKTFLFLDMDNDGKDELYVGRTKKEGASCFYSLDCYKYISNKFVAYPEGNIRIPIDASVYNSNNEKKQLYVLAGDFKGEGKPQFVLFKNNNKMVSQYGLNGLNLNTFGGDASSKIFLTDTNGNGKAEIAYRNGGTITFYEYNGSNFTSIFSTNQIAKNAEVYTGDFNGDGNTDLLIKTYTSPIRWNAFISTGVYFIERDLSSYITWDNGQKVMILDANQDGKSDILMETQSASTSNLKLFISDGNGFITKTLDAKAISTSGTYQIVSNFKTGNSKDIFIPYNAGNYMPGSSQIISLCNGIRFNKIKNITDSFGQQLTISYKDNKNPYPTFNKFIDLDDDDGEKAVISNFLPQLEVVSNITATGINQSYEYKGTQIDRQSKGFLGFATTQTTDNIRSVTAIAENKFNSTYNFLYPYKNTVKTTSGTLISEAHQTYAISSPGTKRYYLKQDSLVSTDALKGITVKTAYSDYDTDRNPKTIKTDYGNGITNTQALTYVSKGSIFLNKIASQQITQKATGQTDVVRKEYFLYDNNGNPTYHVTDSTGVNTDVNKVQTFYGNYDKYGNPGKITTTANGISRSKSMTYCSSGRFLKTKTDNQFNETTTYNYDESKGLLTSKIDRLGTTSYQYDSFGRLKLTTNPDGIKTANALQWAGKITGKPDNAKYYSYTETSGQSPVWIWYDAQNREIRRDSYGLNNKKIMVDTKYNAKSLVDSVSDPYFENATKTWAA
ncbi:MAG: FG-GAP-like repeat-containing protein, partial [Candidatus Azobacteroides sp.]|nr:FG-GAP-like repeat-containing protein [Candidatus Azobacteroides sp.]